jgi:hypothetical protein
MGNSMPEPAPQTWLEKELKSWKSIIGVVVVLVFLSDIRGYIFPDHPAPVALEADGKSYVACNTPDINRGLFHLSSTYSVDFEDNNGSTISLRGVEKLIVTNLPKEVDAPMPSGTDNMSDKDSDGKPFVEGNIYNWDDGTEARWHGGKWLPVKIKNSVCESDNDRDKRLAQEEEKQQAHHKRAAEVAAVKLAQTCKEWEQKHPLGSPVDVWGRDGSALDGSVLGTPEGCEGSLETAYREKMEQAQASKEHAAQEAATQKVVSKHVSGNRHWATANSPYSRTIFKRCHFDVDGFTSCGYASGEVAELKQGDRVEILSGKIRSASGTEILEVRFQSWVGWMDATDLTLDIE